MDTYNKWLSRTWIIVVCVMFYQAVMSIVFLVLLFMEKDTSWFPLIIALSQAVLLAYVALEKVIDNTRISNGNIKGSS